MMPGSAYGEPPDASALPEHSEHGASSCKRWWNCPGSVALCRDLPNENSPYAQEGTDAHHLGAVCLQTGQAAEEWTGRTMFRPEPGAGSFDVSAEMAEHVQVYLDHVRSTLAGLGPSARHLVEHRFTLASINPPAPMYGTADSVIVFGAWLFVDDLKFGQGVQVEAAGNPQLRYYALGALLSLTPAEQAEVKYIRASIVQPRAPGGSAIRSTDLDPEELLSWTVELMDRAAATLQNGAPFVPGDWCKDTFCKARGSCRARAESAAAVAGLEFVEVGWTGETCATCGGYGEGENEFGRRACSGCGGTGERHDSTPTVPDPARVVGLANPALLSAAEKSKALHLAPMLEQWLADLHAAAKADISRGDDIPGWKLVPTRPSQSWTDPAEADSMLEMLHEFGEDRYEPRKLISPAQARDALADRAYREAKAAKQKVTRDSSKAAAAAALAPLITKASSGLNLVPAADERPAIPAGGSEFLD